MRLEELVNKNYDRLNGTDKLIWKYIYNHKKQCANYSINELAGQCHVSRTTIMRFAQKLSLEGYSELKLILKREQNGREVQEKNEIQDLCHLYHHIVQELENKDFTKISEMIYKANRIFAFGSGAFQKNLVSELQRIFFTIGKYVVNIGGSGGFRYLLDRVTSDDMVIIISLSGESEAPVELAQSLKLLNVPLLSVTKFKDNTLAFISDENIYISVKEYRIDPEQNYPFEPVAGFFTAMELMYMKYQTYERGKKCENSQYL